MDANPGRCPGLDWGRAVGAAEGDAANGFILDSTHINLASDGGNCFNAKTPRREDF